MSVQAHLLVGSWKLESFRWKLESNKIRFDGKNVGSRILAGSWHGVRTRPGGHRSLASFHFTGRGAVVILRSRKKSERIGAAQNNWRSQQLDLPMPVKNYDQHDPYYDLRPLSQSS